MNQYKIEWAKEVESKNEDDAMTKFLEQLSEVLESDEPSDYFKVIKINKNPDFIVTDSGGGSLMGYVKTKYADIVKVFGEPPITDGDKTTVEWCIEFANGVQACIYDYKTDFTPLGLYEWHIGGYTGEAVELVAKKLGVKPIIGY